ncbi:hypothetical protein F5Y01DRAFT_261556 [Xylaria sp. FL0043]|nr:hypothetical protein F5Y01DRAFT_261556 [Xylaria sp. FL0043]
MVDAMTRPLDSWGSDLYAPRHASYYSQDHNPQALRLPPPSSLVSDAHHSRATSTGRERAFHNHPLYRDVYPPVASMSGHRPAQFPNLGPESHASTFSSSSRASVDTRARLSPANSSTASDRSEDLSDYPRLRQYTQDQRVSPTSHQSPHFASVRETPLRHQACVETRPMRHFQDAQSQHTHSSATPQSSKALQKAPQRIPTSAAVTSTYRISIRQQPVAARSCGYGERDRRVIDPPPIIQSIMHCTIWNEAGDQDLSSMPEDYRTQRRLMGTVVSSPFAGNDENDEYGCFFCFPDLSCRTPGSFRLQFSFMVLDPLSSPGHRTPVAAIVMSDVFTVYNAKDFPGMKASTALTKRLKEQGCLISIKKGNDRTRARDGSESEDEYEEDAPGGGSQRRSKRARKS